MGRREKTHGGWGVSRFKRVNECGHPERKHYAKGLCLPCWRLRPERAEMRRAYYQSHRADWAKHGATARARRSREAARYGISREQQVAMLEAQGYRCAICRQPDGALRKRLGVDHCHRTGKVRGFLCLKCNRAIGMFGDDLAVMLAAVEYVRAHGDNPLPA